MTDNSYKNWDAMSDLAISKLIGEFVNHHRIEQNKTQEEVATAAGVSKIDLESARARKEGQPEYFDSSFEGFG